MKINVKSLEFANHVVGNRSPPSLFYMLNKKEKLNPSDYQTYKLQTNSKDDKLAVYLLMAKYYKVGTLGEWLQFINAILKVIKGHDIQDLEATYNL
eukprot:6955677-Ditylum_brightwellii.AAC.1